KRPYLAFDLANLMDVNSIVKTLLINQRLYDVSNYSSPLTLHTGILKYENEFFRQTTYTHIDTKFRKARTPFSWPTAESGGWLFFSGQFYYLLLGGGHTAIPFYISSLPGRF
ncbi:unnamed protein product, partial [Owenia fusiformis]